MRGFSRAENDFLREENSRLRVEVLDRNLFILPASKLEIKEFIQGSKIAKILNGYRGEPPLAIDKLCDLIIRFAIIFTQNKDIEEMEINPAIVTVNDAIAVDAKVTLKGVGPVESKGPKFKSAALVGHKLLASKFHQFDFETEGEITIKPGQYVSVKVADNRINAYSVTHIESPKHFSLLIDTSPGGVGSKYFESLKIDDKVSILGPFGIFTYKKEDDVENVLFLATGSGISAVRCMIEEAVKDTNKKLNLYFGLRHENDIFWKDLFEKIKSENPNFNFKQILSQPTEKFEGLKGHITDFFVQDFSNLSKCSAYICGNNGMIEESVKILTTQNCPKEKIYTEKFY